jgi:hypothetical protein
MGMNKHLRLSSCVLSVVLLIAALPAFCWGPVGHRTVADVAESFLSASDRQILSKYLQGASLADVSTWADTIKDKPAVWSQTFSYHYESVDDRQTYLQSLTTMKEEEQKNGGAVAGILEAERIFRDPKSKADQKNVALKFLIHFVGDLHQPFHTGRPEDRGGNLVLRKWHNKATNLHAIWDVLILEEAYGKTQRKKQDSKIDDAAYAESLTTKFLGQPLPGQPDDMNEWINESLIIRDAAYKAWDEDETTYTQQFIHSVDERIFTGGVRLAAILSSLVHDESESQLQLGFRKAIEDILGPLEGIINLNPKSGGKP